MAIEIENAHHISGYDANNTKITPKTINGITFTEFSRQANYIRTLYGTLSPLSLTKIVEYLNAGVLDNANNSIWMILANWNGAQIEKGNLTNGNTKTISSTPEFLSIIKDLCGNVYDNVVHLNKELSNGNYDSLNKLTGGAKTYQNLPGLADLINILAGYIYLQLEKKKTVTKGDYRNSGANNDNVKDVDSIVSILSNLCSDFYTYVYEPKNKSGAVKNSYVISTPCGQNLTNPGLPFTSINDGEVYDVIYYNSGTSNDYTISINNAASLTNLPSGCTIKVPDGIMLEIECPKNGYCELNYLRVGNYIYVRGA